MYSVVQRDPAPAGSPLIVNLCFISISFSASRMVMVAVGLTRFQKPLSNSYVWLSVHVCLRCDERFQLEKRRLTSLLFLHFSRGSETKRGVNVLSRTKCPQEICQMFQLSYVEIYILRLQFEPSPFSSDHEHLLMFTNNNEERMSRNRWRNRWLFRKVLQNTGRFREGGVWRRTKRVITPPPHHHHHQKNERMKFIQHFQ